MYNYSSLKSWTKGLKGFIIFVLGTLVMNFILTTGFSDFTVVEAILWLIPDGYEGLTLGGLLTVFVNYLRHRWNVKII